MTFGEKVARLLSEQQRTQRWLAREVKTSPNTISKVANGGDTSYRTALRIARVLEVDANWLLDDNMDWPPTVRPSLANVGPQELVAELARRRELIRSDMRNIAAKLTDARLVHLDRLSAFKPSSQDQQDELQHTLRGLVFYQIYETQLEWLEPDAVHPTAKLPKLDELLKGYDHLLDAFNSMRGELRTSLLASPLAARKAARRGEVARYDRDGGTFPAQPKPARSRSRSTPKRRATGKKAAPAKPHRPKRPPRS